MRKKRNEEEKQSFSGSAGISQKALEALERGTYGQLTNRQAKYRTSQEQTQAVPKSVPALEGMTRSPEFSGHKSYVDTDRARAKYAKKINYTPFTLEKTQTSNDENYIVKRDRYNKLMRDSRLANDIKTLAEVNYKNANQDATVSQEYAENMGAKHITGGFTKDQFIKMLGRRYSLTPKELEDMALTFHSDANKADVARYGEQLQKIGEAHPVLGSAGSLVGTLGSGVEGAYNTVVGGISGDDRYLSNMFSTTKKSPREGAKKNIKSDGGKTAYDIGMGIGDMAVGAAAGSAPAILAGNTANEAQESAMKRGSSVRKSSVYGAGAGVLDFVTNKIGLDKAKKLAVDSIKSSGVKKFLAQNAIAGMGEAGENVLQDVGQSLLDLINGGNAEFIQSYNDKISRGLSDTDAFREVAKEYATQLATSGALGFGMGSAMQAGTSVLPKIPYLRKGTLSDSNASMVDKDPQMGYNDVITKGDVANGRTEPINGTGNTGNTGLGEQEPVLPKVGGEIPGARQNGQPNSAITRGPVVDEPTRQKMNDAGINDVQLRDYSNDYESYSKALDEAKKSNPYGAFVDSQTAEDLANNNAKAFMSENGGCGVAVKDNKNIVGVFKNKSKYAKPSDAAGAARDELITARLNGGDRLDCYGSDLVDMYSPAGFEPTHKVRYEYGINPEMDAWCEQQKLTNPDFKEPDIVFMKVRDGESVDDTLARMKSGDIPDYDEMLAQMPYTEGRDGLSGYEIAESERNAMLDSQVIPTGNVNPDERVRSFSRRGSVDETLPDDIRNTLSEDYYKIVRNKDVEAKADSLFVPENLIQTRSNLDRAVQDHDPVAALLSYRLAKAYVDNGNYDAATDVLENVSAELTRMGQFTQAAKLAMLQNDPMAAMRSYMRDLEKLNQWGSKKYKGKWNNLELSKEDIDLINSVQKGDSEGLNAVIDALNEKFSKQIPSNWWDKTVGATKTAMLLNPRTQFRNALANLATLPLRSASDRVAAVGQNIAHLINDDVKVNQSVLGGTKAQKKLAGQVFDRLKDEITGENKMKDSVKSDILSQRQTFNDDFLGKWIDNLTNGGLQRLNEKFGANGNQSIMETLQNLTYWLMGDVGDTPFVKRNFVNRLASYMKAQGINNIDDIPDDAISIATQEALKATFKDDNAFTKALQGIKQKSGKFGEVALPFVKTPANLTMRAVDYSPAGLINTFRKIRSNADASAVIDDLSKNITGTALIYLGYKLAEKGILSGSYSDDADEAAFQKQQGMLENAIRIGDNYYTYDWTQPASTPLVLGQTIYEAIKASDKENASIKDVVNATYKGGLRVANTIINSSPLQSLSDLLGDSPYGEEGVAENFANEVMEFPQRFIPSILGATARTIDPVMRDTYIKDSTLTGALGNQARQAMAKIPFLSRTLPASYDTWGNERTRSDSRGEAFIAQMVNPGQLGNKNETPLDAEIQRIFDETGDKAVFPLNADRSLNLGKDGNITLTNKQHSDYQKAMGQRSYEYAESIMNSPEYKNLSDNEKAVMLGRAYKLSNDITKEEMFNHVTDDDKQLKEIARQGDTKGVVDYLYGKAKADALGLTMDTYLKKEAEYPGGAQAYAADKQKADALGLSVETYKKKETEQPGGAVAYTQAKQTAADLGVVDKNGKPDTEHFEKVMSRAGSQSNRMANDLPKLKEMGLANSADYVYANAINVNPNITIPEFTQTYNEIDTDKGDKLTQKELLAFINKYQFSDNSDEDMQIATDYWKTYQDGTWKKSLYIKKDGTYGAK